jgi:hypothetical protein
VVLHQQSLQKLLSVDLEVDRKVAAMQKGAIILSLNLAIADIDTGTHLIPVRDLHRVHQVDDIAVAVITVETEVLVRTVPVADPNMCLPWATIITRADDVIDTILFLSALLGTIQNYIV